MGRLDEKGTAAVEFAIATPLLAMMVIGVVEIGFSTNQQIETQAAAAAGALYATENGWNSAAIAAAVTSAKPGSNILASPAPSLSCGCPTSPPPVVTAIACGSTCPDNFAARRYVLVSASKTRVSFLASTLPLPTTLNATATARIP